MKSYKYHYWRYNEFDVVKVNLLTVLATLFMARHALALLIIGMALRGGRSGKIEAAGAFDGLIEPIYMTADIPAMLVLLAMICRHPKSGTAIRFIWRGAPYLLLASTVIYLALLINLIGFDVAGYGWPVWLSIGGTAAAVGYVFLSPYARDLFRQFPERYPQQPT